MKLETVEIKDLGNVSGTVPATLHYHEDQQVHLRIIDESPTTADASVLKEALEYLINDIKSKPNDTRYATAIKKATDALSQYNALPGLPADLYDPFPTKDVLRILVGAAKTLLDKKNYDGPDHEEIFYCVKRGEEILSLVQSTLPNKIEESGLKEGEDSPYLQVLGDVVKHMELALISGNRDLVIEKLRTTAIELQSKYHITKKP